MKLQKSFSQSISGRTVRRIFGLLMAAVLVLQPVSPAVFADVTKTDPQSNHDNSFHYVAIGDSVAAGFDLETNTMIQNIRTYLPQLNYNNSSDYCYPSLTAQGLDEILQKHGITDAKTPIECTNFGFAAYRIENYINLIEDPDYVVDFNFLRNTYITPFTEEQELYDNLQDSDKASYFAERRNQDHDSLKTLLSDCYGDDDPDNNQSTALMELSVRYGLSWHTNDDFRNWYEMNVGSDMLFDSWFDDWYGSYMDDYYPKLIHGELAKIHDIFVDNIADADLISIDVGSNNMLYNYLLQMVRDSMGADPVPAVDEKTGLTYYKNINNPLNYIIASTAASVATGGDSDAAMDKIPDLLEIYRDDIDINDVTETLAYYSYDTMKSVMLSYVSEAMEKTPELADKIEEVSRSNGKPADLMYISRYAAMGKSIEVNRTAAALINIMRDVMGRVITLLFHQDTSSKDIEPETVLPKKVSAFAYDTATNDTDTAVHEDVLKDSLAGTISSTNTPSVMAYVDPITSAVYTEDTVLEGILSYDNACEELRTIADEDSSYSELNGVADAEDGTDMEDVPDVTGDDEAVYDMKVSDTAANYNTQLTAKMSPANLTVGYLRRSYEKRVSELVDEAVENLRYNLVFLLFGRAVRDTIIQYNEQLSSFAEDRGYIYVDIFGIPDDTRLDPHPLSEGHRYIADQILAAADTLYSSKAKQGETTPTANGDSDTQGSGKTNNDTDTQDNGKHTYGYGHNLVSSHIARMNSIRKLLSLGYTVMGKHILLHNGSPIMNAIDFIYEDDRIPVKLWSDDIQ